nr:hypothetical protein [Tanacetum cinerariifolium]
MKSLINSEYRDEIKIDEHKGNFNRMSIEINKKEKLQQLEQVANLSTYPSKRFNSFCYDDDDDDDEDYTVVITPNFLITDSLIMENEHLDTISEMESEEFIKSIVENLVPIPSESEDFSDIEIFNDFQSSLQRFYLYNFNPIHKEDLDSTLKNARFDTKSYVLESLLNRVTFIASSPKFDSLLEEFSGINEANCNPEEDINLVERLLYDNSSPIPVEDSDPFMEEIDLFLASDGSIPPGIDSDYSDSE